MKKWIVYVFTLAFAAYWASNLLLWFPWSYSAKLGMTMMLTVSPLLWAYATFLGIKTFQKTSIATAAVWIAGVFLIAAIIFDYVFFGIIRGAMEELYHPTTFYGYGFLIFWPLIIAFAFRKKFSTLKTEVTAKHFKSSLSSGFVCLFILTLIIVLDIKI